MLNIAVDLHSWNFLRNSLLKITSQLAHTRGSLREIHASQFCRRAKPCDTRNIFRARSFVTFVMPAVKEFFQSRAFLNEQGANTFRRVNLVPRKRKQINAEFFYI